MAILKGLKKKHNISVDCFSHDAMKTLQQYNWPGNVRELENTLERVVLIHDKPIIKSDDVNSILKDSSSSQQFMVQDQVESEPVHMESADPIVSTTPDPIENTPPSIDTSAVKTLKELEYEAISAGLARTNWNMTTTAQQLGISRMTLYRKLDQHGLRKKDE